MVLYLRRQVVWLLLSPIPPRRLGEAPGHSWSKTGLGKDNGTSKKGTVTPTVLPMEGPRLERRERLPVFPPGMPFPGSPCLTSLLGGAGPSSQLIARAGSHPAGFPALCSDPRGQLVAGPQGRSPHTTPPDLPPRPDTSGSRQQGQHCHHRCSGQLPELLWAREPARTSAAVSPALCLLGLGLR